MTASIGGRAPEKPKTKMKNKKQSPKSVIKELRKKVRILEASSSEGFREKRRADRYEQAYRDLKNNLGQYLAMFANDLGVDHERARKLQEAMFKEPAETCYSQVYSSNWVIADPFKL